MNQHILESLHSAATVHLITELAFIFFAKYLVFILFAVLAYLIYKESDKKRRIYFIALATLSLILSLGIIVPLINQIYPTSRPFVTLEIEALVDHPASSSFPSRHIMFTTPLALAAFYLNRRAGYWFFIGVLLMGVARIGVGVHWPLDILGGIVLGAMSFYTVKFLLNKGGVRM